MSSLSRRLALLRSTGGSLKASVRQKDAAGEHRVSRERIPPGEGWRRISEGAWERTIDYPGLLPEVFRKPFVLPGEMHSDELVFYDLETTGLSGGAGNIAFLIGLGRQSSGKFIVTQLFLGDYPGEPALMGRYAELIEKARPQVSYNGRSFDSQVLRTRFLLNRMPPLIPMQIDLLHPSRRLWKGQLENLSLGTLEKQLLGFFRKDDLPGREAPEAWFDWLRGDEGRISGVFAHNADDIVSLARLLVHLENWGRVNPGSHESGDGRPPGVPPSARGLARQWSYSDPGREEQWLERGWAAGEVLCGRELALRYKREGKYTEAVKIWNELSRNGGDYSAATEIAKYYEHRQKTPLAAFEALRGLETLFLSSRQRRELIHRKKRLEGKMKKFQSGC